MNDGIDLITVAKSLVAAGKGILAADESSSTISKRFSEVGVASSPENRRAYRELLFTTPGIEAGISGVILFDETLRQSTQRGIPLPQVLISRGIIPGIKVDLGTKPLAKFPEEQITEGLDGLRQRLEEYRTLGARFAKWRAVIHIGPEIPSWGCVEANAHALARYAALCQEIGLVPIVEPEVLMDGDHDISAHEAATVKVQTEVFQQLRAQRVELEAMLLKPNMILPGINHARRASPEEVAKATLRCLRRTVPAAVPGIVFLSGGQQPQEATQNLHAMVRQGPHPWQLSFSFGRALQEPVLAAWKGDSANNSKSQGLLAMRVRCASAACLGRYSEEMEKSA